jgi:hypothetical protein
MGSGLIGLIEDAGEMASVAVGSAVAFALWRDPHGVHAAQPAE